MIFLRMYSDHNNFLAKKSMKFTALEICIRMEENIPFHISLSEKNSSHRVILRYWTLQYSKEKKNNIKRILIFLSLMRHVYYLTDHDQIIICYKNLHVFQNNTQGWHWTDCHYCPYGGGLRLPSRVFQPLRTLEKKLVRFPSPSHFLCPEC